MSRTPSVHNGITISVQACRRGVGRLHSRCDEADRSRVSAHLVEPAEEAQTARCCLGRVQTGGASCVVVVDLCCLGDAVQQMVVRYGGTEGQILAHHLENIFLKKASLMA